MGNLWFKNNPLELYLNDVYKKECVFKASQEEVEFIQTGIETLVQDIVDEALDKFSTKFNDEIDEIFNTEHKTEINKYFERDLIDVYFPIKKGSHFQDLTDIKPAKSSIIKVGSFYEGTKNNFPDEFDFIFLLFCGRRKLYPLLWIGIQQAIQLCIESVISKSVCYFSPFHYASPNGKRRISLNPDSYPEHHGPAYLLQFDYYNNVSSKKIAVDLVPAYKIVVNKQPDWYVKHVNDNVQPESFHGEIMSAESCFVVDEYISFTDIEVSFIRNVLSRHHVQVYRILKFLINGHGDDEIMKKYLVDKNGHESYKAYSSYMIKTMMIYHHDKCRNSDTTDKGPCVLQVMEEMCKSKNTGDFPSFSEYGISNGPYLADYLQSLIEKLKSIQTRTLIYSYQRYKTKSLPMQYLEREHMD